MAHAKQTRRFDELDALRGIAALIVVCGHALRSSPAWGESALLRTLDRTPLHLFVAGREAVILFFVLSGFVLSLPFWNGRSTSFGSYAVKRVARIYLPYLIAMAAALGLFVMFAGGRLELMGDMFNKHWQRPLTAGAVADHLIFIRPFDSGEYGMVYWSLIHELRISLIFPFVMLLLLRLRTPGSFLLAALLSIAGTAWAYNFSLRLGDGSSEWAVSLHITALFVMGAMVAKHREWLVQGFSRLGRGGRWAVVLGGAMVYLYARRVTDVFGEHAINQAIEHWLIGFGGAIFMIAAMATAERVPVIRSRPLLFLGKASFGLYLYHGAIIWAMVWAFHDALSLWFIYVLAVISSLVVAWVSFRWIEQPAMGLGKALAAGIEAQRWDAARQHLPQHLFTQGVWNRAGYCSGSRPMTPW